MSWSPLVYSHFDLDTSRSAQPPISLQGLVTDSSVYSLSWRQNWSSQLESKVVVSELDQTYRYVDAPTLKNRGPQYSLSLTYLMRRWLRLGAEFDINERYSDAASYEFRENVAKLEARITF